MKLTCVILELLLASMLGLMAIVCPFPVLKVLAFLGAAFLLYLAYLIAVMP